MGGKAAPLGTFNQDGSLAKNFTLRWAAPRRRLTSLCARRCHRCRASSSKARYTMLTSCPAVSTDFWWLMTMCITLVPASRTWASAGLPLCGCKRRKQRRYLSDCKHHDQTGFHRFRNGNCEISLTFCCLLLLFHRLFVPLRLIPRDCLRSEVSKKSWFCSRLIAVLYPHLHANSGSMRGVAGWRSTTY